MMDKIKKSFRKSSFWIMLYSLFIILCIFFYCADVFIYQNSPMKHVLEAGAVIAGLATAIYRMVQNQKANLAIMEKTYADKIENAFEKDEKGKKLLLKALLDYNNDCFNACIRKLNRLMKKGQPAQEAAVVKYFTAVCFKAMGKLDGAFQLYQEILAKNPAYVPALSNLSVIYFDAGKYEKVIELAEKALECSKDNPYVWHNLASAYFRTYNMEKAEEYALKALQLKRDLHQAESLLAMVYAAEGDMHQAKQYMDRAIASGKDAEELRVAMEEHRQRYVHHNTMEARISEWKKRTGVPSIHFTLDGKYTQSIIGGRINETAPISESGKKMRLLAAVFCSELPENDIFPKKGVLRFYISPDSLYGSDFDEPNRQKEFKVLFDENEARFLTSAYYGAENEGFPIRGSYRPCFVRGKDAMPPDDFRYEAAVESLLKECGEERTRENYHEDDFVDGISHEGHKLGGYPFFTQWDPRKNNEAYKKYDVLLFQLNSEFEGGETKVMFGDSGVCNFFIPAEKLKNHDFSDILYTWDCH